MTPSRRKAILLVGVVILGALIRCLSPDREPRFNGHPLSYYVLQLKNENPTAEAIEALADQPGSEVAVGRAIYSLGHTQRPEAVPIVVKYLSHTNRTYRLMAISAVQQLGDQARPAISALANCISDPDIVVATRAVDVLAKLKLEPSITVPILIRSLQDSRLIIQQVAIAGLRGFGSDARPAVPALLKMTTDPDEELRRRATKALTTIAPEVLTNAPPR